MGFKLVPDDHPAAVTDGTKVSLRGVRLDADGVGRFLSIILTVGILAKQFATLFQMPAAVTIGQQSKMPDAHGSAGYNMQQKPA